MAAGVGYKVGLEFGQIYVECTVEMERGSDRRHDLTQETIQVIVNDSIHILDFDWAGKKGEVSYPHELNTSCNLHPDVQPGGLIAPSYIRSIQSAVNDSDNTLYTVCVYRLQSL